MTITSRLAAAMLCIVLVSPAAADSGGPPAPATVPKLECCRTLYCIVIADGLPATSRNGFSEYESRVMSFVSELEILE